MTNALQVVATARQFANAHYKEGENNDNLFGKHYGINHIAWCAEFVSYCFDINGAGSLVAAQSKKGFISCTAGVNWFKANKRLIDVSKAQPGDIVFMNFVGSKTEADHVELVIRNDPKSKVVYTIGGNTTNPDGTGDQANGDGVYYKTRPYRLIVATARPAWETLPHTTDETPTPESAGATIATAI